MKSKTLAAALILLILVFTAVFINAYCHLFKAASEMAQKRLIDNSIFTFFITPIFFWLSAYLCRQFCLNASGHHLQSAINQLKKDPNDFEKAAPFLNARFVIVKAVSSLVASFGGGALGMEGPATHMSAGIFATFANRYKQFLPKLRIETCVISGAAVGLCLAFSAPFAAVAFGAEKLFKMGYENFKQSIIFVVVMVAIVSMISSEIDPMFNFHVVNFDLKIIWQALIVTSFVCAFLAFVLKTIINKFHAKILGIKSNFWHIIPLAIGLIVAVISFYSGINSFTGGLKTTQQALSSDVAFLSYQEVGGRILNTILTFISGSAGGLIAPAIAMGTGIGSIISTFFLEVNLDIFLLIGMAAFLSVILGEPIAAAIIVFEVTGQSIQALPFLLTATLISLMVWKGCDKIREKLFG